MTDCGEFCWQLVLLLTDLTVWYILQRMNNWLWRILLVFSSVANRFDSLVYFTESGQLAMENFAGS